MRIEDERYELNWKRLDPESKWCLPAKKFTGVNTALSFFGGVVFTLIFYAVLFPFKRITTSPMIHMFFHGGQENRSSIPYLTVFLTMWCLAFIVIKWKKLNIQRMALKYKLVPDHVTGFVLSPDNSSEILYNLDKNVCMANGFIVLNRVKKALTNLKNIGRVSDVSSLLNDLAATDEKYTESTYTIVKGIIWAIPISGFIGTVLGLSEAVGGFGNVLAEGGNIETLKNSLGGVTSGLSVAFETTLIALVAAMIIQLLLTFLMQKEEAFLDECSGYCHKNIIEKLKMIDVKDPWQN